jgi:tetratricopeptide (TPR) repeat protein
VYYQAQVKDFEDSGDRNNIKGLAKPFYEQYIQLVLAKGGTPDDATKSNLVDAYVYLGNYAEFKDKDHAKALDDFNKAKELDPTDARVTYYFQTSGKAK